MQPDNQVIEQAHNLIEHQQLTVTVVVPSYGEGDGVVETLASLWNGMVRLGLDSAPVFLSDSSPDGATVGAARRWASTVGCQLVVDHSDRRRSLKQALNVALAACDTDVVVVTNADVVVPGTSLAHLIVTLCGAEPADVVVGLAAADPSVRKLRYRAGRFQLDVVGRLVRSGDRTMRAEGALWAAHRRFYAQWRFPISQGSIADDVELARAVEAGGFRGRTAADALVYKVPPGSIRDFCLQTRRFYYAIGGAGTLRRGRAQWRPFAAQAVRDPVGGALYSAYRAVAAVSARRWAESANSETWEPSLTTKRSLPE